MVILLKTPLIAGFFIEKTIANSNFIKIY